MLANRLAMQYDYYFFVLSVGAYPNAWAFSIQNTLGLMRQFLYLQ